MVVVVENSTHHSLLTQTLLYHGNDKCDMRWNFFLKKFLQQFWLKGKYFQLINKRESQYCERRCWRKIQKIVDDPMVS